MEKKVKKYKRMRRPTRKEQKIKVLGICIVTLIAVAVIGGGILIVNENSDMIKNFFSTESEQSIETLASSGFTNEEKKKLLTLVNLHNPIPENYKYDLTDYKNVKVEKMIVPYLNEMINAAKKDNVDLKLKNGYISTEEQETIYLNKVEEIKNNNGYSVVRSKAEAEKIVPPGGKSDFQTGLSVEFDFGSGLSADEIINTSEYKWLNKNCVNYGFIVRYPKSKEDETSMAFSATIYRFVGTENAKKMRALDLCFEEYCEYIDLQKGE